MTKFSKRLWVAVSTMISGGLTGSGRGRLKTPDILAAMATPRPSSTAAVRANRVLARKGHLLRGKRAAFLPPATALFFSQDGLSAEHFVLEADADKGEQVGGGLGGGHLHRHRDRRARGQRQPGRVGEDRLDLGVAQVALA